MQSCSKSVYSPYLCLVMKVDGDDGDDHNLVILQSKFLLEKNPVPDSKTLA